MLVSPKSQIRMLCRLAFVRNLKLIQLFWTIASILTFAACSDSDTLGNIEDAPFVLPVAQVIMRDHIVWEYLPEKTISRKLLDLNNRLYAAHDTDETRVLKDFNDNDVRFQNPLPDFISYTDSNQLKLFDLETRYTHDLYDFSSEKNPNGPEQICDIQASTIFDKNSFLADGSVLKEELVVQASAVDLQTGDCSVIQDLRFYKISIVPTEQLYSIRQQILTQRRQKLNVGDSSPPSQSETTTGRPLCDPNAELATQDEELEEDQFIYCVTSEIIKADFPIFKGLKATGDDALMYASYPIKNPNGQNYGYLGFDREQMELAFFLRSGDEFSLSELWRLSLPDHLPQAQYRVISKQRRSIYGDEYRSKGNTIIGSNIVLEVGNRLTYLPIRSLFDDDLSALRVQSLNNTLHQRLIFDAANYTPLDISVDASNSVITFIDDDTLITIESTGQTVPSSQKLALNTLGVASFDNLALGSTSLIHKIYNNIDLEQDSAWVYYSGNVENTMLPRYVTQYHSYTNKGDSRAYLNYSEAETWNTLILTTTQTGFFQPNTIAITATDSQAYAGWDKGPNYYSLYIRSEGQTPTYTPSLKGASLYNDLFDASEIDRGLVALNIPAEITASELNKLYFFNDDFALLRLMTKSINGDELKYFYFDPPDLFNGLTGIPTVHEIPICEFELSCSL